MKLDDLIAKLEEFRKVHGGDIDCYGNGAEGYEYAEKLNHHMVTCNEARYNLPMFCTNPNDKEIVVHIGGC